MTEFFSMLAEKAPELVKSPLGLVGLCVLVGAYLVAFWKKARFDSLIARIDALPEKDRLEALKSEMGSVPLPANFSPSDWLMAQRQKYFFGAYFITAVLLVALILFSTIFSKSGTNIVDINGDGGTVLINSQVNGGK
jgi:hypothetical protein